MNSINLRLLFVVLICISAAGAPQARILSPYLTDGIASSAIVALVVLASSTINTLVPPSLVYATNANRNNDNCMH